MTAGWMEANGTKSKKKKIKTSDGYSLSTSLDFNDECQAFESCFWFAMNNRKAS